MGIPPMTENQPASATVNPENYLGDPAESFMAAVADERDRLLELYEAYAVLFKHAVTVDCDEGTTAVERLSGGLRIVCHVSQIRYQSGIGELIRSDLTHVEPIKYTDEGLFRVELYVDGPNAKAWPPEDADAGDA